MKVKDDTTEVKDEGVLNRVEDLGLLEVLDYTSASLLKTHGKLVQGRTYGGGRLTSVDSP